MASAASRNVHSRKLVMLGQTAVGKTCISVRFVRERFVEKPDPTIGGEQFKPDRVPQSRYKLLPVMLCTQIKLPGNQICEFFA